MTPSCITDKLTKTERNIEIASELRHLVDNFDFTKEEAAEDTPVEEAEGDDTKK